MGPWPGRGPGQLPEAWASCPRPGPVAPGPGRLPQAQWRGGPATSAATNCRGHGPGEGVSGKGVRACPPSARFIRKENAGPRRGAVEREGDKSGGRGWLPERGGRLKSFTAPRTQNLLNLHWKVVRNLSEGPGADCLGEGAQKPLWAPQYLK